MPSYIAPVEDMMFLFEKLRDNKYYNEIEKYLNSLTNFGSQNQNWIFNLGHGFLPDIDHKKVKFVVDWIKDKDWNR